MSNSKKAKNKSELIALLHRELRASYSAKWEEGTDFLVSRVLGEIYDEVGETRLTHAVRTMINQEKYFGIEALRRYIPQLGRAPVRCSRCQNQEGWVYVQVPDEKHARALRCTHGPVYPTVNVHIGSRDNPITVSARVLDYA